MIETRVRLITAFKERTKSMGSLAASFCQTKDKEALNHGDGEVWVEIDWFMEFQPPLGVGSQLAIRATGVPGLRLIRSAPPRSRGSPALPDPIAV